MSNDLNSKLFYNETKKINLISRILSHYYRPQNDWYPIPTLRHVCRIVWGMVFYGNPLRITGSRSRDSGRRFPLLLHNNYDARANNGFFFRNAGFNWGFGNFIVPLQLGRSKFKLPHINSVSLWLGVTIFNWGRFLLNNNIVLLGGLVWLNLLLNLFFKRNLFPLIKII